MKHFRIITGTVREVEQALNRLEQDREPLTVIGFSTAPTREGLMLEVTVLVSYEKADL